MTDVVASRSGSSTALDCATQIVDAALLLARSFNAGGRLLVRADACPDHAHHVVVEFVHPVITGARSLPALALLRESAGPRASGADCCLVIGSDVDGDADLVISSDRSDAEIMVTYHVLWELVQVCLEHPGLVGADAGDGVDSTGFLYPFLDASESDERSLRHALESSADAKRTESKRVAREAARTNESTLAKAISALAVAILAGGRILTIGNGGSSTDAGRIVRLLTGRGVEAMSLASDYAVLSALANDLGADRVFSRQVEALARPGDALVGCSTSGTSRNLLVAFEQADAMGVTGIGISGYGGGAFVHQRGVDQCLVVASTSVHRIQEAQAVLIARLCEGVDTANGAA